MQSIFRLTSSFVSRFIQSFRVGPISGNSRQSSSLGLFNALFPSKRSVKQPKLIKAPIQKPCDGKGAKVAVIAQNNINPHEVKMHKIPPHMLEEVVLHQRKSFYCRDPLHKALGICQDEISMIGGKEYAKKTIEEGMSVMALSKDGKVVAAHLIGRMCPGAMRRKLSALGDPKSAFDKIMYLKYKANLKENLFEKYGVDAIYDMKMISVENQSSKIALEALTFVEKIARDTGYKLIKAEASGVLAENSLKKLGFETASETRYDSILDKKGNVMVPVKEPNTSFKIMVKKIN